MKKILYLTFYFEPDLCAGSFRNSPLVKELSAQSQGEAHIDVVTTLPNRYSSFEAAAPQYEERDNHSIYRIAIPKHQSGMRDQVFSFKEFYTKTMQIVKSKKYDLVVASSSRLFTAFLGYKIAKKMKIPLYLDIRDIFYDTLEDVLPNGIIKTLALPVIKRVESRTFNYASHINLISEGFKSYFNAYNHAKFTFYPNGIDDIFIDTNFDEKKYLVNAEIKSIVYAGNIGEGQGLHKIIPLAAQRLGNGYQFVIIGDGGAKRLLIEELKKLNICNVELRSPVKRDELIAIYKKADFLFAHLNNYKAFERVLPSKLFELATFPQPIIAGVAGFAANFVRINIENSILFNPCDVDGLVNGLNEYSYKAYIRTDFIKKFSRSAVNQSMAQSMLEYIYR